MDEIVICLPNNSIEISECLKIIKSEDWLENFLSCQFDPLVNSQGAVAPWVILQEDGHILLWKV